MNEFQAKLCLSIQQLFSFNPKCLQYADDGLLDKYDVFNELIDLITNPLQTYFYRVISERNDEFYLCSLISSRIFQNAT